MKVGPESTKAINELVDQPSQRQEEPINQSMKLLQNNHLPGEIQEGVDEDLEMQQQINTSDLQSQKKQRQNKNMKRKREVRSLQEEKMILMKESDLIRDDQEDMHAQDQNISSQKDDQRGPKGEDNSATERIGESAQSRTNFLGLSKPKIFGQQMQTPGDQNIAQVKTKSDKEMSPNGIEEIKGGDEQGKQEVAPTEKKERDELKWATEIDQEETFQTAEESQYKPQDTDVYPLSISYTKEQTKYMKIIRIVVFISLFFLLLPYDLYVTKHYRIYYFGTDIYRERIDIPPKIDSNDGNSSGQFNFTFHLQNCKVYFYPDEQHTQTFLIEYGFEYGTSFSQNSTTLSIQASPTETCVVNLYLPASVNLPLLVFNMTGLMENIVLEDSHLNGIQLNFSSGLKLYGQTAFIYLNNHNASFLDVNFDFSVVKLYHLNSPKKTVKIKAGLFSDVIDPLLGAVGVLAEQDQGNICLSAASLNSQTKDCLIISDPEKYQALNDSLSIGCKVVSVLCQTEDLCKADLQNRTKEGLVQAKIPVIDVLLDDGPIQVMYSYSSGKSQTLHNPFLNDITFAASSLQLINNSAQNTINDQANTRIEKIQTIGASYEKNWVFTNKIVYLQAQYWSLIWGSAGLLRPKQNSFKAILIDNVCPARSNTFVLNERLSKFFENSYPKEPQHAVAFTEDYSQFYQVMSEDLGIEKYKRIEFIQNKMLIAAFTLAAGIAVFGGFAVVSLLFKLRFFVKKQYHQFLIDQKQLSVTMKQLKVTQGQEQLQLKEMLDLFQTNKNFYENRHLFSSDLIYDPKLIQQENLTFSFSFYQLIYLALDYLMRLNLVNSFIFFLDQIDESELQFPQKKMKQYNKAEVSIPAYQLQAIYSEFCVKYSFKEQQILSQENEDVLASFGLQVYVDEGKVVPSYVNIRFKTFNEKKDNNFDDSYAKENSISKFLLSECQYSSFDSDYISMEELDLSYKIFCKKTGIPEDKVEQIIGSKEMTKFGFTISERSPPKRILGLKKGKSDAPKDQIYKLGLVRIKQEISWTTMKIFSILWRWILQKLTEPQGLLLNTLLSVILFLVILIVPIITPCITFIALCEMTQYQSSVYARVVPFSDFYMANRLDPWWDRVPDIKLAAYFHIYVLVYLFFAYTELLSFYLTGYNNNGKISIRYSLPKKFFTYSFYLAIAFFLFFYVCMLWFALVWGCLAAIFNPSVFLPYTAAALTLITTIIAKINYFKDRFEYIKKNLTNIIKAKLGEALIKSLENYKEKNTSIFGIEQVDNALLNDPRAASEAMLKGFDMVVDKATNSSSSDNNQSLEDLVISNVTILAKKLTQDMNGMSPKLIQLLIAIVARKSDEIGKAANNLGTDLKINGDILESLITLALSQFNSDDNVKQDGLGMAQLAVKNLFKALVPDLPIQNRIGEICKLVLDKDPEPLMQFIQFIFAQVPEAQPIIKVFSISINQFCQDRSLPTNILLELAKEHLDLESNEQAKMVFNILLDLNELKAEKLINKSLKFIKFCQINDGNPSIETSDTLVSFRNYYPLLCYSNLQKSSSVLSNRIIVCTVQEILCQSFKEQNQSNSEESKNSQDQDNKATKADIEFLNTDEQKLNTVEEYFFALQNLVNQGQIQDEQIAVYANERFPHRSFQVRPDDLKVLFSVSQFNETSFTKLISKLGLEQHREILVEFYSILTDRKQPLFKICEALQVDPLYSGNIFELIHLLQSILQYEILIADKNEGETQISFKKQKEKIRSVRNEIQRCLANIFDKDENPIKIYKTRCFQNFYQTKNDQVSDDLVQNQEANRKETLNESQSIDTFNLSSIRNSDIDHFSLPDIEILKDEYPEMTHNDRMRIMLKKIFPNQKYEQIPHQCPQCLNKKPHQTLWDQIVKELKSLKMIDSQILSFIKKTAFILLKLKFPVIYKEQEQKQYLEELSEFFQIDYYNLEFIIDAIFGDPFYIFKVSGEKGNFKYKISMEQGQGDEFQSEFDQIRFNKLQKLIGGSQEQLTHVFLIWYHEYNTYQGQGKSSTMDSVLESFNLNNLFYQAIQQFRYIQDQGTYTGFMTYIQTCNMYLRSIAHGKAPDSLYQNQFNATNKLFDDKQEDFNYKIDPFNPYESNILVQRKKLLAKVIDLKQLDKVIIKKLIGDNYIYLDNEDINVYQKRIRKALRSYLVYTMDFVEQPHKYFNMIMNIADLNPIIKKTVKNDRSKWQKDGEGTLEMSKGEFMSLVFVLNAKKIQYMCKSMEGEFISKARHAINSILSIESQNKFAFLADSDVENCIEHLHDNNFLRTAEYRLLHRISEKFTPEECQGLVGIMLGKHLQNKRLMRTSLLNVISSIMNIIQDRKINSSIIDGMLAVLLKDEEPEDSIRAFCEKQDINAELLINIIQLTSQNNGNLQQVIISLLKTNKTKTENEICQAFINLFKGDMSQVNVIINKMGIENNKALAIFAIALGNTTVLSENVDHLSRAIGLKSSTINHLVDLQNGQTKCLKVLQQYKDRNFCIYDLNLVEQFYQLQWCSDKNPETIDGQMQSDYGEIIKYIDQQAEKLKESAQLFNEIPEIKQKMRLLFFSSWNDNTSLQNITDLLQKVEGSLWEKVIRTQRCDKYNLPIFLKYCLQALIKQRDDQTYKLIDIQASFKYILQIQRKILQLESECYVRDQYQMMDMDGNVVNKDPYLSLKLLNFEIDTLLSQKLTKMQQTALHKFSEINQFIAQKEEYKEDRRKQFASKIGCTYVMNDREPLQKDSRNQLLFWCQTHSCMVCYSCSRVCHSGCKQLLIEKKHEKYYCKCSKKDAGRYCQLKDNVWQTFYNQSQKVLDSSDPSSYKWCFHDTVFKDYTVGMFITDLEKAMNFREQPIQLNHKKQGMSAQNQDRQQSILTKLQQDTSFTLTQNIVFFAKHQPTNQFLQLLSYRKRNGYNAILGLLAIAKRDFKGIALFQKSLSGAFNEKQNKKDDLISKVILIMMLSKNDDSQMSQNEIQIIIERSNLFQQFFGVRAPQMMILHRLLTMSRKEQLQVLDLKSSEVDLNDGKKEQMQMNTKKQSIPEEIIKMRKDLDYYLFEKSLGLNQSTINHFKNILGVLLKSKAALINIAEENKIPKKTAQIISNLIMPENRSEQIQTLNLEALGLSFELVDLISKIINFDSDYISHLIMKFKLIKEDKNNDKIRWLKVDVNENWDQKVFRDAESIYQLITKQEIDFVVSGGILNDQDPSAPLLRYLNIGKCDDKKFKHLANTLSFLKGCSLKLKDLIPFKDSFQQLLNIIVKVIENKQKLLNFERKSLINVLLNDQEDGTVLEIDEKMLRDFQDIIDATSGQLYPLMRIADRFDNNDTNFRQFIASFVMKQTGFNLSLDNKNSIKNRIGLNMIKREVFRFFEKAVNENFKVKQEDQDSIKIASNVEKFIEREICEKKTPLYFLFLMTNQESFVNSMTNVQDLLISNSPLKDNDLGRLVREMYVNYLSTIDQNDILDKSKLLFDKLLGSIKQNVSIKALKPAGKFFSMLEKYKRFKIMKREAQEEFRDPNFYPRFRDAPRREVGLRVNFQHDMLSKEADQVQDENDSDEDDIDDIFNTDLNIEGIEEQRSEESEEESEQNQDDQQTNLKKKTIKQQNIDIIEYMHTLFMCLKAKDPGQHIQLFFKKVVKQMLVEMPEIQMILKLHKAVIKKNVQKILNLLPQFMVILIWMADFDPLDKNEKFDFVNKAAHLADSFSNWINVIRIILKKEKLDEQKLDELQSEIRRALRETLKYQKAILNNIQVAEEVFVGLISLSKGDLKFIKPLAIQLGEFPENEIEKLEQIIKVIKQFKDGLRFEDTVKTLAIQNVDTAIAAIPIKIPGGQKLAEIIKKGIEDPATLMEPRNLFDVFANEKGTISFEEFKNIFTQLSINVPHAVILQIFSAADRNNKGELRYQDFIKASEGIKDYVVYIVMENLGFSIKDIILSFIWIISMLIMMFAFILVGIEAFSPQSSFASVTNSFLPIMAGVAVNQKSNKGEQKPEELKQAAEETLDLQ